MRLLWWASIVSIAAAAARADSVLLSDRFIGGSGNSSATAIVRDAQGNIYIAGSTNSVDLPILNGVQSKPGTAPVLSTADAGKTWTYPSVVAANTFNWIAGAPGNPSLLYAATNLGVLRSTDNGATWTAAANNGLPGALVQIAVDAAGSTLYARSAGSVFASTDGGGTWSLSGNGLPINPQAGSPQVVALCAHASRPGTVFAATQTPDLFRSVDYGKTWASLRIDYLRSQPLALVSSPASPHTLILVLSGGLLQSLDDGDTWAVLSQDQLPFDAEPLAMDPANPANLYLATYSGLQASTDGGQTWRLVLPNPTGQTYPPTEVAIDPRNSNRVYAAGSTGLFASADAGQTWVPVATPYPVQQVFLFVSPGDSRLLLTTSPAGDAFIAKWNPAGDKLLYSTYLGGSGADIATGIAVDAAGSAYVVGQTSSPDFPVTPGAFQTSLASCGSAFVAKLSPDGSRLLYSTLLGGGRWFHRGHRRGCRRKRHRDGDH